MALFSAARALLQKEVQEHALLALALTLVLILGEGLMLLVAIAQDGVTALDAHANFCRSFLVLIALFVGHRLVVREYAAHTQRFLAALPIPKTLPLLIKLGLAGVVLFGAALTSFATALAFASLSEPLGTRLLAIVIARTLLWTAFLWLFVFAVGLTGRFRSAVFLMSAVFIGLVLSVSPWEFSDLPPFALVGPGMVTDGSHVPWGDLAATGALCLLLLALAAGLAYAKEGTIADSLAGRLSTRERSSVAALSIAGLVFGSQIDDCQKDRSHPVLRGALVREQGALRVYDATELHPHAAVSLLNAVEKDLTEVPLGTGADEAGPGCNGQPPSLRGCVQISLQENAPRFGEIVRSSRAQGALVRVSPPAYEAALPDARGAALTAAIVARTDGRGMVEHWRWFTVGYPRWRVLRTDTGSAKASEERRRAWGGTLRPISRSAVDHWLVTEDQLGAPVAASLGALGVETLATAKGNDAVEALARAWLQPREGAGSIVMMDRLQGTARSFESATGLSYDAFINRWAAAAKAAAARLPADARVTAKIEVERLGPTLRRVRASVRPGGDEPLMFTRLVDALLGPFDSAPIPVGGPTVAASHEHPEIANLLGRYGPGERVFLAVEVVDLVAACPIRLQAERRVIR